jgi:hypothetical protein
MPLGVYYHFCWDSDALTDETNYLELYDYEVGASTHYYRYRKTRVFMIRALAALVTFESVILL